MKNGAFLKENKGAEGQDLNQLTANRQQTRKKKNMRRKNRRKQLWFLSGALAVLLIALLIIVAVLNRSSPLEGKWFVDDVTAYEFYDGGKGAMVLPSAEYAFEYSVKDDTLRIDFEYEGAKDAEYTFSIDADTLTLEGGNRTTQGKLVLKKGQ